MTQPPSLTQIIQETLNKSKPTPDPWDAKNMTQPASSTPKYNPPSNTGYKGNSYAPKKIRVLYKNGMATIFTLNYELEGWYQYGKLYYPETDNILEIPEDRCEFTYAEPRFNACVYTATNDYMQARWGRKLDDSDRRWLARHPYATDGGIPQEYTATCVDQLVAPYGMRISRVRIRRGTLVLGDSVMDWIKSLGCNPMALSDRNTSNVDAAKITGLSEAEADAMWRVEFHEAPLPCSIVGERGWSNGNGVTTGFAGGHARYLAPRAQGNDWFISVQLAPENEVSHLVPPPNPEYKPRNGDPTLLVSSIKLPDSDELVAIKTNYKWHRPGETPTFNTVPATTYSPPANSNANGYSKPPKTKIIVPDHLKNKRRKKGKGKLEKKISFDQQVALSLGGEKFQCGVCQCNRDPIDSFWTTTVCYGCVEDAWKGSRCPHCKSSLGATPPMPNDIDGQAFEYECQRCQNIITVPFGSNDPDDQVLLYVSDLLFESLGITEDDSADMPPLALGSGASTDTIQPTATETSPNTTTVEEWWNTHGWD